MRKPTLQTTLVTHSINAEKEIEDARRTIVIATQAADDALMKAACIVRRRIMEPRTCSHPGDKISKATAERNQRFQQIHDEIMALVSDPLPF